jgi:hypothetical protein
LVKLEPNQKCDIWDSDWLALPVLGTGGLIGCHIECCLAKMHEWFAGARIAVEGCLDEGVGMNEFQGGRPCIVAWW